jgi:putative membrane protein
MKSKILLTTLALSSIPLSSALAQGMISQPANNTQAAISNQTVTKTSEQAPQDRIVQDTTRAANKREGKILAVLITADNDEISAAKVALAKNVSPSVKNYAQKILHDHQKHLDETYALSKNKNIKPIESKTSQSIQRKDQEELSKLQKKDGTKFEKKYVKEMVKTHENALALLDKAIPKIKDPQVKQYLVATRAVISEHLQMGQMLDKQMAKV